MNNDFENPAIAIIVVFGALTIGGLMGAAIGFGDRDSFLFALGSSAAAWAAGYAMIFQKPHVFRWLLILAIAMAVLSTVALIT